MDIIAENIEFCRRRFDGDPRFEFHLCDGMTFPRVPDASVSLVYCLGAMVHYDSDTVRSYLREIRRVLPPGGRAFCHHSNYVGSPTGDFRQSHIAELHVERPLRALGSQGGALRVARQGRRFGERTLRLHSTA